MKMKLLTAIAITTIGALHAVAAQPTLLDLAKARDAKVAAAQAALTQAQAAAAATNPPGTVDPKLVAAVTKAQSETVDHVAKLIGPDWREAWETSTLPDPDAARCLTPTTCSRIATCRILSIFGPSGKWTRLRSCSPSAC